MKNGRGKSDSVVVPRKPSNGAGQPAEETVEGRTLAKGNSPDSAAFRTQGRVAANRALERVRYAARRDRKQKFTAIFHHIYDVGRLRDAYRALEPDASAGVDGETWRHYSDALEHNLEELAGRLKRGTYQAQPVRRVYIPKPDGQQRPIGVPTLEDKIVQRAVVEVLNAIYEQDFVSFSYGFRPGLSQHHALDALAVGLDRARVNWVLDADIRGFFDAVDHEWMVKFVEHRIGDRRVSRLIQKWMKAGVLEERDWQPSETGTVQGGSISPLLANIYLHYVFDLWAERWRRTQARGDMIAVRYADDTIVGFQHREDAERFLAELRDRFATFGLALHPDKTRIVPFGPRVWTAWRVGRGQKPGTFDFLGFTHISGTSRAGKYGLRRKTIRKRWHAKLRAIKIELGWHMHDPVPDQRSYLSSVLSGHYRYYGVPGNYDRLGAFRHHVIGLWRQSLSRRSQKGRVTWDRMKRLARGLPLPRICHPWPSKRFDVRPKARAGCGNSARPDLRRGS